MAQFIILVLQTLLALSAAAGSLHQKCKDIKTAYKDEQCCKGTANKEVNVQVVPNPKKRMDADNVCAGAKPYLANKDCMVSDTLNAMEQSGGDVSLNYVGGRSTTNPTYGSRTPITEPYYKTSLCPVNVHWHLGAEHRSHNEFDEGGKSPKIAGYPTTQQPDKVRYGFACHHYSATNEKFKDDYDWKHCVDMHVGETYEVHWPHSSMGSCGTPNQYQSPFYDGVFCHFADMLQSQLPSNPQTIVDNVGVQGQVFTIINDEDYYYPDLIRGMIVDGENNMGKYVTAYTGSTTGTTRSNTICSSYAPITWQVDRKCHLISASSFDKMCADMKQMRDDMSGDLHPHGARELVSNDMTANNQVDMR